MTEQQQMLDAKESDLNLSQALIHIINANILYCLAPRASGKTSGMIGPRILHLSEKMPRAQIGLVCDTYERISKSILPGLESYWASELGLMAGVDYVIGKKPPDHWTKPLYVPKKWDHVISFATGFIVVQISLEVEGSANGFNLQAIIGDEIKYWDEAKFNNEVVPAVRGGNKQFGHLPEFQSYWLFSDKLPGRGADISWALKKKKEMNQDLVDVVYTLQMEVFRLQQEMESFTSTSTKYKYQHQIDEIEEILRVLRMDLVYYRDAEAYENRENLGDKYFRTQKRILTAYQYKIAIENEDPDKALDPYYNDFSTQHLYQSRKDCNPNKSLIIALDYQHSITPVVTAQFDRLNGSPYTTLNFIQSMHAIPGGIDAAMKMWCDHYQNHPDKIVYYVYDHTAIGRSPHGKTYKEKVVDYLTSRDWAVIEIYTGDAPDHGIKHESLKKWLAVTSDKAIRVNEVTNEYLVISINKSDTVLVNGKTKKDKSSEKSKKVPPEESTHYSDTFDQIVWGVLELDMVPMNDDAGIDISRG